MRQRERDHTHIKKQGCAGLDAGFQLSGGGTWLVVDGGRWTVDGGRSVALHAYWPQSDAIPCKSD